MDDVIECDGTITEAFKGIKFNVECDIAGTKHTALCTLSGKLKIHYIKCLVGDRVKVQISPYDLTKGRIIWRYK